MDTAGKLGLDVAALSDEAILGAAHFLEAVDDAGKAKQTMTALMNGVKNGSDGVFGKWHAKTADEYFSYVRCVPKGTKGFGEFLGRVTGVNKVRAPTRCYGCGPRHAAVVELTGAGLALQREDS